MRLIGCDLHASQQSIAMLDRDTGEIGVERRADSVPRRRASRNRSASGMIEIADVGGSAQEPWVLARSTLGRPGGSSMTVDYLAILRRGPDGKRSTRSTCSRPPHGDARVRHRRRRESAQTNAPEFEHSNGNRPRRADGAPRGDSCGGRGRRLVGDIGVLTSGYAADEIGVEGLEDLQVLQRPTFVMRAGREIETSMSRFGVSVILTICSARRIVSS
jgi:hypothetical protein